MDSMQTVNSRSATLYGLGVGPGNAELLTLKALRLLQSAPVLCYPAPQCGASLVRQIAAQHIPNGRMEIVVRMPMKLSRFPAQEVYDWAALRIGEQLDAGRDVVYLCEGDPFFYGSFSFLYQRMIDRYAVEVVPGVSSLMACAGALGIPLATRNEVLCILPATAPDAILHRYLKDTNAAMIIKVGLHLARLRALLETLGLLSRAYYIEYATMANEKAMPLAAVEFDTAPYFSVILIR